MDSKFPDSVLDTLRKLGCCDFQTIKINSSGTVYGRKEYVNESVFFQLFANKNLQKRAIQKHPQMQMFLNSFRQAPTPIFQESLEYFKSSKASLDQRETIIDSYRPFISQILSEKKNNIKDVIWWERETEKIESNSDLLAFFKEKFDGMELEDQFKPQIALVFDLNFDSKTRDYMNRMTNFIFSNEFPEEKNLPVAQNTHLVHQKLTSKLASIKKQLKPQGFTLTTEMVCKKSGDLSKFSSALEFARCVSHPKEFVEIEKRSGDESINFPASYKVHSYVMQGVVVASRNPDKFDKKFKKLIDATTDGCHPDMRVAEILDKLKIWDQKFGVKLLCASFDRFELKFTRLPDHPEEFCEELFELCPNLLGEIHGPPEFKNSIKAFFVEDFKTNLTVSFWWK